MAAAKICLELHSLAVPDSAVTAPPPGAAGRQSDSGRQGRTWARQGGGRVTDHLLPGQEGSQEVDLSPAGCTLSWIINSRIVTNKQVASFPSHIITFPVSCWSLRYVVSLVNTLHLTLTRELRQLLTKLITFFLFSAGCFDFTLGLVL